jgi:hypothetical protein
MPAVQADRRRKWYVSDVALPLEMAEEELKDLDEAERELLTTSIHSIFDGWKGQHRELKERADRTKAHDDESAVPKWLSYIFVWDNPIELFFRLWTESYLPLQKYLDSHPHLLAQTLATLIVLNREFDHWRSIRRAGDVLFRLQRKRDHFTIQFLLDKARLGQITERNLRAGPAIAAETKKIKTKELHRQWAELSADLHKHKPGWTLEDHAMYIQTRVPKRTNGKPYAVRTIMDAIKGQRSAILPRPNSTSPD